ncbi:unnamed protein product [Bursaphelenchus xylophilus]|uniref:(pine wood nematode) hypothetical protein n=1 Tax=Bursaphelenchus xylophilus TaxID=6326 RepID=A0A7I8WHG3_BURXY|nr:unnamed protein product [Bursaphelenchus xylophilus]CAG9109974.1 unnamed protein product [Bursaphelenchus xylophilus]
MLVKATVLFVILLSIQHLLAKKTTRTIPGGWQNVSVNDPKVQKLAEEAVKIYSKYFNLEEVRSAEQQVVAGFNYRIHLIAVRHLGIRHAIHVPLFDQVYVDPKGNAKHNVTVEHTYVFLYHSLSDKPPKGAWFSASVDDPEVQKLAKEAVDIFGRQKTHGKVNLTLDRVRSAQRQIVAGNNYKIHLEAYHQILPDPLFLYDKVFVDPKGKASHTVIREVHI